MGSFFQILGEGFSDKMATGLVKVILDGLSLQIEKVLLSPVEIDKGLTTNGDRT